MKNNHSNDPIVFVTYYQDPITFDQMDGEFLNQTDFPVLGFDSLKVTIQSKVSRGIRKKKEIWIKETFEKKKNPVMMKREEKTWDMQRIQKNRNSEPVIDSLTKMQLIEHSQIPLIKELTQVQVQTPVQVHTQIPTEGPWIVHYAKPRKSENRLPRLSQGHHVSMQKKSL